MHCHQVLQLLVDYVDGELDEKTHRELEEHMQDCEPCKAFIRTYEITIRLTKKVEISQMPAELKDRLHSFLRMKTQGDGTPN